MRLGIFLFYDAGGKVSDHVVYLLAKFAEHLDHLIVVSNGPILASDEARLAPYADKIILRRNTGFDVGGYIDGIMSVGFDQLSDYDELILFNYTVFGPIFDLAEMFSAMAQKDVDFWGVTEFRDDNKEFLQSYFLATRKSLHSSPEFRDYWLNMPAIEAVDDSVKFHEFRFTPHFMDLGFRKGVYIENEESWRGNTTLLDLPGLLDKRLPIVKYRAFNFDAAAVERRGGLTAASNFALIAERTNYPVDFIWDYIISQTPVDQIVGSITGATVTDRAVLADDGGDAYGKAVVFLSVEDELHMERIERYFDAFDRKKLFAVSSNDQIASFFNERGWTVEKSRVPFTGAPLCAFAGRLDTVVSEDDVVFNLSCFAKDRDNYRFRDYLIENYWGPMLSSERTIAAVSQEFADNPRIGLMFAPTENVFGRTTRFEPLCPRASNWAFDAYPHHVFGALKQGNWPWRGNAALSGRLVRNETFMTWLCGLQTQVKHGSMPKVAGIEGAIAELARGAGYAAKLAVTQAQSLKLIARGTLSERNYRSALQAQAVTFAEELSRQGDRPGGYRSAPKAPAPLAPSRTVLPAIMDKAGSGEADKASGSLKVALSRAEQRATKAETALEQAKQARARTLAEMESILAHLTPRVFRQTTRLDLSDGGVVLVSGEGETQQRKPLARMSDAIGSIDLVRREMHRIQIKGWSYNTANLSEMTYVAVVCGQRIVKAFTPCVLLRSNLGAKIGRDLPHENSGFAMTIPLDGIEDDTAPWMLVFGNAGGDLAIAVPLTEGPVHGGASPAQGAMPALQLA